MSVSIYVDLHILIYNLASMFVKGNILPVKPLSLTFRNPVLDCDARLLVAMNDVNVLDLSPITVSVSVQ